MQRTVQEAAIDLIGYVEGQNVAIEYYSVEGYDRPRALFADLVGSGVDAKGKEKRSE